MTTLALALTAGWYHQRETQPTILQGAYNAKNIVSFVWRKQESIVTRKF